MVRYYRSLFTILYTKWNTCCVHCLRFRINKYFGCNIYCVRGCGINQQHEEYADLCKRINRKEKYELRSTNYDLKYIIQTSKFVLSILCILNAITSSSVYCFVSTLYLVIRTFYLFVLSTLYLVLLYQTLNLKCITSPSCTRYSLPSIRKRPLSRQAASLPYFTKSS